MPCLVIPLQVAEARLELARANAHGILNPERLPIPPLGQELRLI